MKKLTLLMVFVLLFSITIMAGNLSKEEIISELKEITIITNRDKRLEMYDILAGKLGLKVVEDTIINEFSGSGSKTTRPLNFETAWEIYWESKDGINITLYDKEGNFVESVAGQMEAGEGNSYNPKKGKFCLNIFSMGDWKIKIIAIE